MLATTMAMVARSGRGCERLRRRDEARERKRRAISVRRRLNRGPANLAGWGAALIRARAAAMPTIMNGSKQQDNTFVVNDGGALQVLL